MASENLRIKFIKKDIETTLFTNHKKKNTRVNSKSTLQKQIELA